MTYALAALLALAVGWCIGYRTHAAAARIEHAIRPTRRPIDLEDGIIRVALAAACCETWWTSVGAEHDHHCTRKDHTL